MSINIPCSAEYPDAFFKRFTPRAIAPQDPFPSLPYYENPEIRPNQICPDSENVSNLRKPLCYITARNSRVR